MIADLKTIAMQFSDFFPSHVVAFVGGKSKPSVMKNVAPKLYLSRIGRTIV